MRICVDGSINVVDELIDTLKNLPENYHSDFEVIPSQHYVDCKRNKRPANVNVVLRCGYYFDFNILNERRFWKLGIEIDSGDVKIRKFAGERHIRYARMLSAEPVTKRCSAFDYLDNDEGETELGDYDDLESYEMRLRS